MYPVRSVLLLDRNYIPDRVISWRDAFDLVMMRNVAEIITEYDNDLWFRPSVIRLKYRSLANRRKRRLKFFKGTLLFRDNYTCVYCGRYSKQNLTIDHVIPICRGGQTSYENCVAACFDCNQWKGGQTPVEAGMRMMHQPTVPTFENVISKINVPTDWHQFLQG